MKKLLKIIKKTFKIIAIVLAVILAILILMPFISYDISKEKLGPSPFGVDESISSEDNPEFKKLLEIGQEVQGYNEFKEAYELDLNNPQPSILLLQDYLKKNEGIIEKADFELFKNCKFPKPETMPKEEILSNLNNFRNLLNLLQSRISLHILTEDFEKVKSDLVLANNISHELFKKVTEVFITLTVFINKYEELNNIKLFLCQDHFTIDQKLEVLNIKQEHLTSQLLKTIAHFECEEAIRLIQELKSPNSVKKTIMDEQKYYPIITPFLNQPNKTGRLFREMANEVISDLEIHSKNTQAGIIFSYYFMSIFGNYVGNISVEIRKPLICLMSSKILNHNSKCDQLFIAQKILLYKKENGVLPTKLSDLKIDKKKYTYYDTNESFLYYEPNGILQNASYKYKHEIEQLTMKKLTSKEIQSALNSFSGSSGFIIYLK